MSASNAHAGETVFGTRAFEGLQEISADEMRAGMAIMTEMASRDALGPVHRLVLLPDDLPRQAVAAFTAALAPSSFRTRCERSRARAVCVHRIAAPPPALRSVEENSPSDTLREFREQNGALVDRVGVRLLSEERSGQRLGLQLERYPGIDIPGFGHGRMIEPEA